MKRAMIDHAGAHTVMLRFNYRIKLRRRRPGRVGDRTIRAYRRSSWTVKRARNPRRHGQHIDVTTIRASATPDILA